MRVLVEKDWGVVEGLGLQRRQDFAKALETETTIVGNRLKFRPSVQAILYLRDAGATFEDNTRTAWGYLFKQHVKNVEFSFKTPPYPHQQEGFDLAKDRKFFALFWEMGLGKTKTALDIAAWKYATHRINAILVVTLNGVHRNWVRKEAPVHLGVDYDAAFWNPGIVEYGMRGILDSPKLILVTINFDSVHTKNGKKFCERLLNQRRTLMVIDESHCIKTPSSKRTRAIITLGKKAVSRMIMTGTPVANSPLDVFKQMEFLDKNILGEKNYTAFKRRYAIMQDIDFLDGYHKRDDNGKLMYNSDGSPVMTPIQEIVGYRDVEKIKTLMQPHSSRKTKDDCLKLPDKVYRRHSFILPDKYRRAYKQMAKEALIELRSGGRVTAKIALSKIIRLQQLICGFVVPDGSDLLDLDVVGEAFDSVNPRLNALLDVLEEVQGKCIIWVNFRYSIMEIERTLVQKYGRDAVATFSGMTSDDARDKAEDNFQDPVNPLRFLIAQPQAGGTGRTFTQARDVIYWSNSYNLIHRLQSEDRAHRIGQTGTVTYTDLEALDTIDEKIIEALIKKVDIAAEITGDSAVNWLTIGK